MYTQIHTHTEAYTVNVDIQFSAANDQHHDLGKTTVYFIRASYIFLLNGHPMGHVISMEKLKLYQ